MAVHPDTVRRLLDPFPYEFRRRNIGMFKTTCEVVRDGRVVRLLTGSEEQLSDVYMLLLQVYYSGAEDAVAIHNKLLEK